MAEIHKLSALRWGAPSHAFCMLTTRNERAVLKGQAISDSCGYLCTAQHGMCQGTECGLVGVGIKNHRQFPKRFLKTTLSAVGLPLLLGTGLGSGFFTVPQAETQPCPKLHPVSPVLAWSPSCGSEHSQAVRTVSTRINLLATQSPTCLSLQRQSNCLTAISSPRHHTVLFQNPPCFIS